VAVQAGGNLGEVGKGQGMPSAGVALRYRRAQGDDEGDGIGVGEVGEMDKTPVAGRFRKYAATGKGDNGGGADSGWYRGSKKETFEEMIASSVKAFVGLIYQEQVSLYHIYLRSCLTLHFLGDPCRSDIHPC